MTINTSDILPLVNNMASCYSRHKTHVHVAFVFGPRKVLLGWAINKVGSRSMGAGYSSNTIHAERAVLKQIGDNSKLRGAELVVIRVGKQGDIKSSMPCNECKCHLEKCMRVYGLRCVYYS
jgi:cytidine deaminase